MEFERRDSFASSSSISLNDLLNDEPATPATPTRMSWFLVEADEGLVQGKPPTGKKTYSVLHAMEVVEDDFTEKYVSRTIKFRKNGHTIKAKLIMATDERSLIDGAIQGIKREQELARKEKNKQNESSSPTVLVQYYESTNVLVQKLIKQDEIKSHIGTVCSKGESVIIAPNQVAQVLHVNDDYDYMQKLLMETKANCFDIASSEQLRRAYKDLDRRAMLLIAISSTPSKTVYRIIPYQDTIWQDRNLFKQVVAYIGEEESVTQVLVLAHSDDRETLLNVLKEVEDASLNKFYANQMRNDVNMCKTARLLHRGVLFDRAQARDTTGKYRQLRTRLDKVCDGMQREAQMLIGALQRVQQIDKGIHNHMNTLKRNYSDMESD